ncbi:Ig-like domain-containing protein, partial [Endozoicomonas atrinae]|uniref:Ig-like domain-containing protein n=1 Tax=Endozoicomonas atrinae TaxID=1333660 RepID=UPI001930F61D
GQDGEGYGAFARIVDSNGQPIGNEFSVSSDNSLPAQVFPDVTALSDGGFIVTWQSGADLNNGQQIWAQRYDSLGAPVNNAFRVGAGQTDKQPTVVELSDGTLAFSWQDNDAYEIRTQLYKDGFELSAINEDDSTNSGNTIAEIVTDGSITDIDGNPVEAVAITSVDNSNGSWEYSVDGGANWAAINDGSLGENHALLLDASNQVRFVPNADFNGAATFTVRAWDKSAGAVGDYADTTTNGGTTAFSPEIAPVGILVNAVNDAPVVDTNASLTLTTINEDDTNSGGNYVYQIAQGSITDLDGYFGDDEIEAMAITSVDNTNGTWQYKIGWNDPWINIDDGSLADNHALLLDSYHKVRFVPNTDYNGDATFDFRAWDRTSGTAGQYEDASSHGGTTAFSADAISATISLTAINDAPVLTPSGGTVAASAEATSGGGFYNAMAATSDGGYLHVWNSSGDTIKAQRYDSQGVAQGTEITVHDDPNNITSYSRSVTVLDDGGFVVSWSHYLFNGSDSVNVWSQIHNADGSVRQAAFQLNTQHTFLGQKGVQSAALPDGGFVTIWDDQHEYTSNGGQGDLYMRRYDADGTPRDAQEIQITTSSVDQEYPAITVLNDGNIALAWREDGGTIHSQRVDSQGNTISSPIPLTENTSNNVGEAPAIASLSNGGYVVTWMDSTGADGQGYGVYARIVDSQGQTVGSEFAVTNDNSFPD